SYQIVLGADTSTDDTNYRNLDPPNVLVVNQDNEIPGYTVSLPSGSTTETGGTAFFTVVLNSVPSSGTTVQLELSSSDTDEGQITAISGSGGTVNSTGTSTLDFSTSNWNSVRTVTVKGQNDSSVDGHQAYAVNLSVNDSNTTDSAYDALDNQTVLLTNVDDETAGFVVSDLSGTVSETGTSAVFSVRLTSEPNTTVTVAAVSDNTTEASVSPSSWQFTTTNWSGEKQFTVTGVDDNLTDGNQAFSIDLSVDNSTSSDTMYEALNPPDVLGTNIDDDTAGFTISAVSGPSSESGGIAMFAMKLNMAPTDTVTVYATSADTTEGKILQDGSDNQTTDNLSVVFTTSDWNSEHQVRVKGQDDNDSDGHQGFLVQLSSAVSTDARYNGLDPSDVAVSNYDDETAGFMVSSPSGSTSESGDNATFTVRLTSSPSGSSTVVLDVDSSDDSEGLIENSTAQKTLTYNSSDWSTDQTITVTGQDDVLRDGNQPYTINITLSSSSDSNYSGLNPPDVQLTNMDDEFAGIRVSAPSASITSEGGDNITFTVTLNTTPIYDVTIPVFVSDSSEALVSVNGGAAADNVTLTFSAQTTSSVTVTVIGQNDNLSDSDQSFWVILSEATSQDESYLGINPQDVALTNTDDESGIPGFIVTAPDNATTTESGQDRTFTVKLAAKPISDVSIPVYVSDSSEALLTGNVDNLTLTFSSSNYDTAQTINAIAQNDMVDDGDIGYTIFLMPAQSSDPRYNGLNPQDMGFVNVDDDSSSLYGFIITSPDNASTSESTASSTFTVKLSTEPTADVTMTYYSSDTSEGTVSGSSLVFSSDNYSTAQTITVTGVDDSSGDGDQYYQVVLMPVTSSDTNYNGADPQDIAFTNLDDDSTTTSSSAGGGFIITAPDNATTTEDGGTSTFTIKLNMAPTSTVSIPVYVSDSTEALLTSGSSSNVDNLTLTFTSSDWSTPQTITVTGQGPDEDYDTLYNVILMPAISSDTNFNGVNPQDLSFVNTESAIYNILYTASSYTGNLTSKSNADSLCNSAKPSGTSQGYAFASFSSTEEIRDLPTTANLNTNLNIKSSSGKLIAENWSDLLDGSINMSLESAGVTTSAWWSFSNN
ncbi:MAG: hypothetical protein VXA56_06665, partial [Deltaproteobacteria bacterium]